MIFLAALYCLIDLFLYLAFRTRLRPMHLTFSPGNFLSSGKKLLLPFFLCVCALWFIPYLPLALLLLAPWPHPFLTAWRDLTQKKPQAHFPLSRPQKGEKLFHIPMQDRPHIIFLVLESLRAKNVGCLGAKEPLTPHFDALAKKGILFTQFHATGNLTNRAIIASLFGIPAAHRPWNLGHYANLPLVGLPQILGRHGYHPALIKGGSTAFDHEAEFFGKQGFQTILGKRDIGKPGSSWGVFDEHLMPYAASWLAEQKKPAFLNLYTVTNHHPWIHPHKKGNFLDTFVYTDEALGLFLKEMKKNNLLEKSLLFIFGDHGQELEDRDPHFAINRHLYQDNVHVPLLIYGKGRVLPQRIDTVASQIDLLPTLLDLMDISDPHHSLGKSLVRASSAPIYFSHPFDSPILGCRQGKWKYLLEGEKEELYNLQEDPEEITNVIGKGPAFKEQTLAYFHQLDAYYSEPAEEKKSPLHLDLSHSLITDEELEKIARDNPRLSSLSIAHCLLLTDKGLAALLRHCPQLEKLHMQGLDDITGSGVPISQHLVHLNALDCPRLSLDWVRQLPALMILQIGACHITDETLATLPHRDLAALYLANLPHITDQGVRPLLEKNPHLNVLSIDQCPQVQLQFPLAPMIRYLFTKR